MGKKLFSGVFWVLLPLLLVMSQPGPSLAETVWKSGVVTRTPWTETWRHIEIDNVKYIFMTDASAYRRIASRSGSFQENPVALTDVASGSRVEFLAQGHRIYQLVVLQEGGRHD